MPEYTVTLSARCHCGRASYTFKYPSSEFPLKSAVCNCSSCRKVTGQLAGTFVTLPSETTLDVSNLTRYATSDWYTRYFCPTCGADVVNFSAGEWILCTGMLNKTEGLLDRQQIWLEATKDGGMSLWLPDLGMRRLRSREPASTEATQEMVLEMASRSKAAGQHSSHDIDGATEVSEKIHASCHCGGVQFYLTRPSDSQPCADPEHGKWWLGSSGKRYSAVLCSCESCRRTSGFEVECWTYVPRENIRMLDGNPLKLDTGTLVQYKSSEVAYRDFCGKCGAAVFFRKQGQNVEVLDVAVGLLNSESGARAEDWLEWDAAVEFSNEAIDPSFVKALEEGMKASK